MSVCTAIGTTLPTTFANTLGLNLASAALCVGIWVCFRYAGQISKRLGAAGADAIVKVFSFILICIGIQVLWAGFSGLWTELARSKSRLPREVIPIRKERWNKSALFLFYRNVRCSGILSDCLEFLIR